MTTAPTYFRKIIRITADDSPNVRFAKAQIASGLHPTGDTIIPGVLPWDEYLQRLSMWDEVMQCIGLRAMFYEGASVLMYPPQWLDRAERAYELLRGRHRVAKAIGIDTGEGKANTSMTAVDEFGVIEISSRKTPDTSDIIGETIAFGTLHSVPPAMWMFDRGGGGKQIADMMRKGVGKDGKRYPVRTVAFGEPLVPDPKRGTTMVEEKKDQREERYIYKNRRAQMYGLLRILTDPSRDTEPTAGGLIPLTSPPITAFAIPSGAHGPVYAELRRQLALIPLLYDKEGQLYLPPKNPPPGRTKPGEVVGMNTRESTTMTMTSLLGRSPDEADSLVTAIYCMTNRDKKARAGTIG